MKGTTVDEVVSKSKGSPKASKEAISTSKVKSPNAVMTAIRNAALSPRSWAAVTCAFLAISGGLRFARDSRYWNTMAAAQRSPFPLEELPKALGTWRMEKEGVLDPDITRIAGASDYINRVYVDDKTGETVSVLVLYGLAYAVYSHTAEFCYPAAGFKGVHSIDNYELRPDGLDKVVGYRGGFFTRKKGAADEYAEVVYSFRFGGDWMADPFPKWKLFRAQPGMYKIQLARQVNAFAVESSPSVPLLGEIVKAIESRLTQVSAKSAKTAAAGSGTPKKN